MHMFPKQLNFVKAPLAQYGDLHPSNAHFSTPYKLDTQTQKHI
jgi:hypothetical protein